MEYLVAIAGVVRPVLVEVGRAPGGFIDYEEQHLPTVVEVATLGEHIWPFLHAAFDRADLTAMFMYDPAAKAAPLFEDALARIDADPERFKALLDPRDWRGVAGNRKVLARLLAVLRRYPDNVIAWGRV